MNDDFCMLANVSLCVCVYSKYIANADDENTQCQNANIFRNNRYK